VGAGDSVFDAQFFLISVGAWAALQVSFLGSVWSHISYPKRVQLAIAISLTFGGILFLFAWAYAFGHGLDGLEWSAAFAAALLLVSFVLFLIALIRR